MSASEAPSLEQLKDTVRREWTDGAAAWRRWDAKWTVMSQPLTDAVVAAIAISPSMRVLDLATGGGHVALAIAEALGPGGHVTATDLIPDMLAIAETKARERGFANLAGHLADLEALPFPGGSFDALTCRLGIMFAPDVGRALRELRRVLKPGGQAVLLVWGPANRNPHLGVPMAYLTQRIQLPPPPPGAPGGFRFAPAGALAALLQDAGFESVQEAEIHPVLSWPGPVDEYWEFAREIGPVLRRLLAALPPDQRHQVDTEILQEFGQYAAGQQVHFPSALRLVTARR